jgi:hypothetical protein
MTTPRPPEGHEPLGERQLREKAREILSDLATRSGAPDLAPAGATESGAPGAVWRRRRRVVLGAILGVLLAAMAVDGLLKAGLFSSGHQVPDELVGLWGTVVPEYADRTFEITKTSVAFGTGSQSSSVYPIKKVAVDQDPMGTLYTIDYTTPDDHAAEFAFWYVRGHEDMIRFKNQRQIVWTKVKP